MPFGYKAIGTVAYMGGVPAVLEPFCWAWGQMIQHNQERLCSGPDFVHYDRAAMSDHAPARNSLVGRFLGDWLIQMDTDHRFDPDIVSRMVRYANANAIDVLSAVYYTKGQPHVPVLFEWVDIGGRPGLQHLAVWDPKVRVLPIGSAGGGCLFIRRKVFDALALAYPGEGAFDRIKPFSEDHSLFVRCKEQGIKCYAAMAVETQHLRIAEVTGADFDAAAGPVSELFPVEALG